MNAHIKGRQRDIFSDLRRPTRTRCVKCGASHTGPDRSRHPHRQQLRATAARPAHRYDTVWARASHWRFAISARHCAMGACVAGPASPVSCAWTSTDTSTPHGCEAHVRSIDACKCRGVEVGSCPDRGCSVFRQIWNVDGSHCVSVLAAQQTTVQQMLPSVGLKPNFQYQLWTLRPLGSHGL